MIYPDLTPFPLERAPEVSAIAVGWLGREHPFSCGAVERPFFDAFAKLASDPWQPYLTAGRHPCPFCVFTGGPAELVAGDSRVRLGSLNVLVPAASCLYVAPTLMLHYMDAHGYAPPEAFRVAVLECPPMRSMPYLLALRRLGIRPTR